MTDVLIDTTKITDWPSFHRVFSQIFGFPSFYGNNMDALVDCLSYRDDPEAETTSLHVKPGETLAIQLGAVVSFGRRCPDLFEALQDACAFMSWRRTREHGPLWSHCRTMTESNDALRPKRDIRHRNTNGRQSTGPQRALSTVYMFPK
ncbi:barstar family protein [Burkholderia gladioli]|uniref:barstar family protein n=1 Tax=Burkholderia gladioli TaxID=28095 RepID=UPI002FE37A99